MTAIMSMKSVYIAGDLALNISILTVRGFPMSSVITQFMYDTPELDQ